LEKNAYFYKSPSAPDVVLFKLQTIDARVPMMDDSLVLKELLDNYIYRGETGGFSLFDKNKNGSSPTRRDPMLEIFRKKVRFWADIDVPNDSRPIWIEINPKLSCIGKIRSIIYQAPNLCIAVKDFQGKEDYFRVVPAMGKTGFLLSPWITTTKEFVAYSQSGTGRQAQSIRIQPLGLGEDWFWKSLEVAFYEH